MMTSWTPASLAAFESEIAEIFNRGEIRAPVHLAGGNEKALIQIFKRVRPQDWICGAWRMHYHCLLKGVPPDELRRAIIAGRSITLCFPEHRIISSAMVGGIAPIALGLAWAAKRGGRDEHVWCFLGDMAMASGIATECHRYAKGRDIPLTIIVEDNGKSVATDTKEVWGREDRSGDVRYEYELPWPHVGTGKFVTFPDVEHKSHGL